MKMNKQGRFRKIPVTIEAYLYEGDGLAAMDWAGRLLKPTLGQPVMENPLSIDLGAEDDPKAGLYIKTKEGSMHVSRGDWIICGVEGEFYPCKPSIFEKTYESVDPLKCAQCGKLDCSDADCGD
jgi:hypothetical protein